MNAGGHVVFYHKNRSGKIEIVRILQGRMNIESKLSAMEQFRRFVLYLKYGQMANQH